MTMLSTGMVTSELQNSLCRRYQEVENVAEYINNHFNIVYASVFILLRFFLSLALCLTIIFALGLRIVE